MACFWLSYWFFPSTSNSLSITVSTILQTPLEEYVPYFSTQFSSCYYLTNVHFLYFSLLEHEYYHLWLSVYELLIATIIKYTVVLDLHWLPVVCWNVKINKDTIPYNYPEFCIAFMHAQVLQVDCSFNSSYECKFF